jgi:prolyl oligopeptidase
MFFSLRLSRLPLWLLALALFPASLALADDTPPKAIPGDLVTDYHGIKVADPYRALEDVQSPQTQLWAKAQASYTRQQLDQLPGLKVLREQMNAIDTEQSPVISKLQITPDGTLFYLKRLPGENVTKLYMRTTATGLERRLIDPEVWQKKTGTSYSINNFTVAPDGRHIAAVISKADAELGELQIFSTTTGEQVLPSVSGIWGELPALWSRDSRSFLYEQGREALTPGGQPFGKMQIFQRYLAGGKDRKLIGWGEKFGAVVREKDWLFIDPNSSPQYTLTFQNEGVSSNTRLSIAPTATLTRDSQNTRWIPVFDTDADIQVTGAAGQYVYGLTFKDAPRYRILRYDLDHPKQAPLEVVAQPKGVLDDLAVAADGLYYVVRTGSVSELFWMRHGAKPGTAERVALPFVGAVSLFQASADVPGVAFRLEGWTRESQIFRVQGTKVAEVGLVPPSKSKIGEDWVAEESSCTSHDGVEVPMSLIYKKGLAKDGSHPTLMDGYGGYGISEPAVFIRKLDPWLQLGGIYVNVKPRGGGAYGREWYQAGVEPRKSNTWKDMIACAQTLIARGYTSSNKLAVQGTSMGGVAVGRSITERPDLFAVGIVRVGITEAVRFIEATSNGPNHEDEMGSVKTAPGIKQLLAMSTYHQIKDGERYPAVLFTAGMNDNRVAPWITFKTFARLSAATSSSKPVLLRIESEGGHGVTTTAEQRNAEWADRLAFILWNIGDPEFQPLPKAK